MMNEVKGNQSALLRFGILNDIEYNSLTLKKKKPEVLAWVLELAYIRNHPSGIPNIKNRQLLL